MKSVFSTVLCSFLLLFANNVLAQFAPVAGISGTSAMHKDSSDFVAWAKACKVIRGYQDISNESLGFADVGDTSLALGPAGSNGVISLGDGGVAILQFDSPITDIAGNDFAVFENSFDGQFLELAFVEVSSDGFNYFRFPATSLTDTATQTAPFGYTDATKIHNLAGKYKAMFGTPFDLADLPDNALLNKQSITHVKIIDVVGSIQNQYCSRDKDGRKVNDPWPTAFGSGGFDLDAVGVIHNQALVGLAEQHKNNFTLFPNPVKNSLTIQAQSNEVYSVEISSSTGNVVYHSNELLNNSVIDTEFLLPGMYVVKITGKRYISNVKLVKE